MFHPPSATTWLFLAVGFVPVAITLVLFQKYRRYATFPAVEGTILKQEIITFTDYESASRLGYIPKLTFSYKIEGREFTGEKFLSFNRATLPKFGSRRRAEKAIETCPPGTPVPVYYDPADHDFAFIRNGPAFQIFAPATIGAAFWAFAALYYFAAH